MGCALSVDDGELFVADTQNDRVVVYNAAKGTTRRAFGSGRGSAEQQFNRPMGVAVSAVGHLYVCDTFNQRVQVLDTVTFEHVRTIGRGRGIETGQFHCPWDVAVHDGRVYDCDVANHRVQVFAETDSTFTRSFGTKGSGDGQFDRPRSIAVSADGDVYVMEFKNKRMQLFDADGVFQRVFCSAAMSDGVIGHLLVCVRR